MVENLLSRILQLSEPYFTKCCCYASTINDLKAGVVYYLGTQILRLFATNLIFKANTDLRSVTRGKITKVSQRKDFPIGEGLLNFSLFISFVLIYFVYFSLS